MKKFRYGMYLGIILTACSAAAFFDKIKRGFQEKIIEPTREKVINPIKEKVIDPAKEALSPEQLKRAGQEVADKILNSAGIDRDGIMRTVNDLRQNITVIQGQAQQLQRNVVAPNGPVEKGKQVAQQLGQLQKTVGALKRGVDLNKIKQALLDPSQSVPAEVNQEFSRALKLFDELLKTTFSIQLNPALDNLIIITANARSAMQSVNRIRQLSGVLGNVLISEGIAREVGALERDFKNINQDLSTLKAAGITNPDTIQNQLADAILFKSSQLVPTANKLKKSVEDISKEANTLKNHADQIVTNAQELVREARGLQQLPTDMKNNINNHLRAKPFEFWKAPEIARDSLNKRLGLISTEMAQTLQAAAQSFATIAVLVQNVDGIINMVKKELEINILTPNAARALVSLTQNLRTLSGNIGKLNAELSKALKLKRF